MTAAIADDFGADEFVAVESRLDDEVAGVSGDHPAVSIADCLRIALEDALDGVDTARITGDQRA